MDDSIYKCSGYIDVYNFGSYASGSTPIQLRIIKQLTRLVRVIEMTSDEILITVRFFTKIS